MVAKEGLAYGRFVFFGTFDVGAIGGCVVLHVGILIPLDCYVSLHIPQSIVLFIFILFLLTSFMDSSEVLESFAAFQEFGSGSVDRRGKFNL